MIRAGGSAPTNPSAASREPEHRYRCVWFWAWAIVGGAGALGLVSLGPIALGPAMIAGAAMARSGIARRSAAGLFAGAGILGLLVAYVQRQGPGTTCWHTATAGACDQHLNPLPWLILGVVLLVGGLAAQVRRTH